MKIVIGIEALKDEFRKAKIVQGDFRGLKNKFQLGARFGVPGLQTYYQSAVKEFSEVYADVYSNDQEVGSCFTMKDLIKEVEELSPGNQITVQLRVIKWNRQRTDADRRDADKIFEFKFEMKKS
jgi:hypothetical protein